MLLEVKPDPGMLGQDVHGMAAGIPSSVAGSVPYSKHRETDTAQKQVQSQVWVFWLALDFPLCPSFLRGMKGFIVATGLASRPWTCPLRGRQLSLCTTLLLGRGSLWRQVVP